MEQARYSTRITQAGPGMSVESVPSGFDLSAAQKIGRQLAEIGDELDQHYRDNLPNLWLLPLRTAVHTHRLARNRLYRGVSEYHRRLRTRPGPICAWLTSLLHGLADRAEWRGTWVKTTHLFTLLPEKVYGTQTHMKTDIPHRI
ncbi:hypothetical protein JZ751_022204 [Albula glossodonta]|uniref:Uncharacterized protein n=1 Tax=Albula glossodonta TaxID=121402 RepID=A0A8T2NLI0_9TELE|nr:hypothetical protein JZ751_022204 [Albula glossodonta]